MHITCASTLSMRGKSQPRVQGKGANQPCHPPTMQWEHQPGGNDMRR